MMILTTIRHFKIAQKDHVSQDYPFVLFYYIRDRYLIARSSLSVSSWNTPSPRLQLWHICPLKLFVIWSWSTTQILAFPPVPLSSSSLFKQIGQMWLPSGYPQTFLNSSLCFANLEAQDLHSGLKYFPPEDGENWDLSKLTPHLLQTLIYLTL